MPTIFIVMKKIIPILCFLILLFGCSKKDEQNTVKSISIDKKKLQLKVGESYSFKVSHFPSDIPAPIYQWTASKYFPFMGGDKGYEVVSIDQNGTLKALMEGISTIKVETADIDPSSGLPFSQSCFVTITSAEGESIKLSETEMEMKPGETVSLTYTISSDNTTYKSVFCESSDSKIVSVSSINLTNRLEISAKEKGEATITVSLEDNPKISATCKVKVGTLKLEGISFDEKEKTIIQGEAIKLTPVFTPAYATNKNVRWTSSNSDVAIVDNDGNVNTIHFGECVITAKAEDGGFEATCKVTVKPVPLKDISFSSRLYYIEIGGEKQLNVIFQPENAENRSLTWESSNPIVVSIDKTGKVKGNTSGNSTITATSEDGGHTASIDIYVVEINRMMNVYFPSSSVAILNGYYTGNISCAIRNNSSHTVSLSKFYVVESSRHNTIFENTSIFGELKPGETKSLDISLNSVYEPIFYWKFEYNGNTYTTSAKYGD